MPIIRNPFRKQDENVRPAAVVEENGGKNGSKPNEGNGRETVEYQLSGEGGETDSYALPKSRTNRIIAEINDSGVYLPPSPTAKKTFWGTASSRSTTSSSVHRCAFNEGDQFSISRESFDSYRRSFVSWFDALEYLHVLLTASIRTSQLGHQLYPLSRGALEHH